MRNKNDIKLLIISFSKLPVYQNAVAVQAEYCSNQIETYSLVAKDNSSKYSFEQSKTLYTTVPENPKPSFASIKLFNSQIKSIVSFIKQKGITDIYFVNKHIWNYLLMRKLGKKINFFHAIHDPLGHSGDKVSKGVYYYNKVIIKRTKGVFVFSEKSLNEVRDNFKIKGICQQIPFVQTKWPKYKPLDKIKKNVLFFGRLNPYKGIEFLPEICTTLNELDSSIKVVIAGKKSDDVSDELIERISSIPNVVMHNRFIAEEEVESFYDNCDMVILPYKTMSQSGIIIDAYSNSKTICCFNIAGMEQFVSEENGFLVSNYDTKKMALTIKESLDDLELMKEKSLKSYEKGEKLYSPQIACDLFIECILKI